MNGGPSWCVPDDGAGPHSAIDANISWGDLDGTVDAWSAVEAVKGERCGDFAIEDLSPGPLRKSSWRDAVEVEYYDDGSTNLDSLDARRRMPPVVLSLPREWEIQMIMIWGRIVSVQ